MPVIAIRGIPGSGKSWIANKLAETGVSAYDTDELLVDEFNKLARTAKFHRLVRTRVRARPGARPGTRPKTHPRVRPAWDVELHRRVQARVKAITARAREPGGPCVAICGVAFPVEATPGGLYFVKLASRDLPAVYRRTAIRNLEAARAAAGIAIAAAKRAPVDEIAARVEMSVGIRAGANLTLAEYIAVYRRALESEKKRGAHVLTQAEIIRRVLKIAANIPVQK